MREHGPGGGAAHQERTYPRGSAPVPDLLAGLPHKELDTPINNTNTVNVKQQARIFHSIWENPSEHSKEVRRARANGQEIHMKELSKRIEDAIEKGKQVVRLESGPMPTTKYGAWTAVAYGDLRTGHVHYALVYGNLEAGSLRDKENVPFRLHSSHLYAEALHSSTSDDQLQIREGMQYIHDKKFGVKVYVKQEGRDLGEKAQLQQFRNIYEWKTLYELRQKIDSKTGKPLNVDDGYRLAGRKTEDRDCTFVAEILEDLGINSVHMLTGNLKKVEQMKKAGVKVNSFAELKVDAEGNEMIQNYRDSQKTNGQYALVA